MNSTKKSNGSTNPMCAFLNGDPVELVVKKFPLQFPSIIDGLPIRMYRSNPTQADLLQQDLRHQTAWTVWIHQTEEDRLLAFERSERHGEMLEKSIRDGLPKEVRGIYGNRYEENIDDNTLSIDNYSLTLENIILPENLYYKKFQEFCKTNCVENDNSYKEYINSLDINRFNYIKFFEKIVKYHKLDINFINNIVKLNKDLFGFVLNSDKLHVVYEQRFTPYERNFQDILDLDYILKPALDKNDNTFEMLKQCKNCNKFFIAQTKKTDFCSPSCRVKFYRTQT